MRATAWRALGTHLRCPRGRLPANGVGASAFEPLRARALCTDTSRGGNWYEVTFCTCLDLCAERNGSLAFRVSSVPSGASTPTLQQDQARLEAKRPPQLQLQPSLSRPPPFVPRPSIAGGSSSTSLQGAYPLTPTGSKAWRLLWQRVLHFALPSYTSPTIVTGSQHTKCGFALRRIQLAGKPSVRCVAHHPALQPHITGSCPSQASNAAFGYSTYHAKSPIR